MGHKSETAVLVFNGDFTCGHCGMYWQFKAVYKNTEDDTDQEIREKVSAKYCMFCGKKHEGAER